MERECPRSKHLGGGSFALRGGGIRSCVTRRLRRSAARGPIGSPDNLADIHRADIHRAASICDHSRPDGADFDTCGERSGPRSRAREDRSSSPRSVLPGCIGYYYSAEPANPAPGACYST
jgi:hypothetical protein